MPAKQRRQAVIARAAMAHRCRDEEGKSPKIGDYISHTKH